MWSGRHAKCICLPDAIFLYEPSITVLSRRDIMVEDVGVFGTSVMMESHEG